MTYEEEKMTYDVLQWTESYGWDIVLHRVSLIEAQGHERRNPYLILSICASL